MSAIQSVEWEPCLIEPTRNPELERRVRRTNGSVPPWMPFFFSCPWIIETALDLYNPKLLHVNLELAEMISLVVSQDNSCRYCYAAHRVQLRTLGVSEQRIGKLEENLLTAGLDDRSRQALDFVRRVSRSSPAPSHDDVVLLHEAGHPPDAVRELAFLAAMQLLFNRITTLPAVPPEELESIPERWMFPVIAPLFGALARFKQRRARPLPPVPDTVAVPFAYVVSALGDLPVARYLYDLIDRVWQSPILPRRTKALIFAVVARALDCRLSEREAGRLLSEEGLASEDIEEVLSHLASDELGATEAAVVPFARDTVRYRPAQIQRQGRVLRDQLSQAQFIEVVGVAAAANAICRLSFLAEQPT